MSEHEDKIKAIATKWAHAKTELYAADQKLHAAQIERERSKDKTDALTKELVKCVGKNIQRRCIVMENTDIVIIEYNEGRPRVSIEVPL